MLVVNRFRVFVIIRKLDVNREIEPLFKIDGCLVHFGVQEYALISRLKCHNMVETIKMQQVLVKKQIWESTSCV